MPFRDIVKYNDLVFGLSTARAEYVMKYQEFRAVMKYRETVVSNYAVTLLERQWAIKNKNFITAPPFLHYVKGHPKYRTALTDPYLIVEMAAEQDSEAVKKRAINNPQNVTRKCKAAIAWAAKKINAKASMGFFSRSYVHFILDKLNFEEVILKATLSDNKYNSLDEFKEYCMQSKNIIIKSMQRSDGGEQNLKIKNRSVTGAELRWIYRNRESLAVQKTIQFWYEGKPCCPPWQPDFDSVYGQSIAAMWQQYIPRSEQIK